MSNTANTLAGEGKTIPKESSAELKDDFFLAHLSIFAVFGAILLVAGAMGLVFHWIKTADPGSYASVLAMSISVCVVFLMIVRVILPSIDSWAQGRLSERRIARMKLEAERRRGGPKAPDKDAPQAADQNLNG